jgi:hypothetical protein
MKWGKEGGGEGGGMCASVRVSSESYSPANLRRQPLLV